MPSLSGTKGVIGSASVASGSPTTAPVPRPALARLREQVVDILGLPEPYPQLTRLFEIGLLESHELAGKAKDLGELLDHLVV